MPKTISQIIAALISLIEAWAPNDSLVNDITDAILALGAAKGLVNSPIINAAYRIATGAEAGLANLESGQAAVVGQQVVDGATYSLVLVKNGGAAAGSLGL